MKSSIIILFLAWMFSSILKNDLNTGSYLAQLVLGTISVTLLPVIIFIISTTISIATGSSWGTIAVMVPLTIPMVASLTMLPLPLAPDQIAMLFPILGALFAGAAAGDHISPIASTTVMSASSAGAYLLDHVHTQSAYAAPALVSSGLAFLISGLLINYSNIINWSISLGTGIASCIIMLFVLNKIYHRKSAIKSQA